jgi:hypothetical protein
MRKENSSVENKNKSNNATALDDELLALAIKLSLNQM